MPRFIIAPPLVATDSDVSSHPRRCPPLLTDRSPEMSLSFRPQVESDADAEQPLEAANCSAWLSQIEDRKSRASQVHGSSELATVRHRGRQLIGVCSALRGSRLVPQSRPPNIGSRSARNGCVPGRQKPQRASSRRRGELAPCGYESLSDPRSADDVVAHGGARLLPRIAVRAPP